MVTLLKEVSNIDIFLEKIRFIQKTQPSKHTELYSSDLETLLQYLIEPLCCIVFQNLLLKETRKNSCLKSPPAKKCVRKVPFHWSYKLVDQSKQFYLKQWVQYSGFIIPANQYDWSDISFYNSSETNILSKHVKDMIVIVYWFSLISFTQTFQWIREFKPAKAGLFWG